MHRVRARRGPRGDRPGKLIRDAALYNELLDLQHSGDVVPCEGENACPLREIDGRLAAGEAVDDKEREIAEAECAECWWNGDEYRRLTAWSPLFRWCLDWLRRRELGLEVPSPQLTHAEEEALLYVHGAIEAGRAERMRPKKGVRGDE